MIFNKKSKLNTNSMNQLLNFVKYCPKETTHKIIRHIEFTQKDSNN